MLKLIGIWMILTTYFSHIAYPGMQFIKKIRLLFINGTSIVKLTAPNTNKYLDIFGIIENRWKMACVTSSKKYV